MKVVNFVFLLLFRLALADEQLNEEGLKQLNSTENFENCGISSNMQILHNQEVEVHSRPWHALVKFKRLNYDEIFFRCRGNLISKRFVLSTTACTTPPDSKLIQVRLGDHHIEKTGYCRNGNCEKGHIDIDVEKTIAHVSVDYEFDNNIALIKLARDVEFNDHIRPICLPISPELREMGQSRQTFGLTGWSIDKYEILSRVLVETMMLREDCSNALLEDTVNPKTHICARDGFSDFCPGLSGDPLIYPVPYYGSQRFVQFGIVSMGKVDCPSPRKQVFTNIGEYIPWISRNILV